MCLNSCSPNHYRNGSDFCLPCNSLCLPGEGCSGPNPADCNACSLAHAPDLNCVRECRDSTYFIRNSTRTCEKCADACGSGGCTEAGPQNCIRQGSLSAGPGTIAFVVIVVLILIAVIVVLVILILVMCRHRGSSVKYKLPSIFKKKNGDEMVRYTRSGPVQDIPLSSIEEKKTLSNPLFAEEGIDTCYNQMGVDTDDHLDVLYSDAEDQQSPLSEKNIAVSASQDLYIDMDYPSPSKPEVSASQDLLYTDMEPMLANQGPELIPALPPKPVEQARKEPPIAPKESGKDGAKPPIPEKSQKLPPPPPEVEAGSELYTDMEGGITEVFVNPVTDDVYDDVVTSPASFSPPISSPLATANPLASKYTPDEEQLLGPDDTYEDTESALAMMEKYRKSFGAGSKSTTAFAPQAPQEPPVKSLGKRQSAPALPSQPIPKKRPSSTANTPLPQTPFQKSVSATSLPSSTSPTSTLTRPGSIVSSGSGIPEEESLYDDIGAIQPLVTPAPAPKPVAKPQPQKRQLKQKTKK